MPPKSSRAMAGGDEVPRDDARKPRPPGGESELLKFRPPQGTVGGSGDRADRATGGGPSRASCESSRSEGSVPSVRGLQSCGRWIMPSLDLRERGPSDDAPRGGRRQVGARHDAPRGARAHPGSTRLLSSSASRARSPRAPRASRKTAGSCGAQGWVAMGKSCEASILHSPHAGPRPALVQQTWRRARPRAVRAPGARERERARAVRRRAVSAPPPRRPASRDPADHTRTAIRRWRSRPSLDRLHVTETHRTPVQLHRRTHNETRRVERRSVISPDSRRSRV